MHPENKLVRNRLFSLVAFENTYERGKRLSIVILLAFNLRGRSLVNNFGMGEAAAFSWQSAREKTS